MKRHLPSILISALLSGAAVSAPIDFNFNDINPIASSPTDFTSTGDIWRANNVTTVNDTQLYATFEIVETSLGTISSQRIRFVNDETERGPRLRMRFNNSISGPNGIPTSTEAEATAPLWARVVVRFFDQGGNEFSFAEGDAFLTQFDDLDSDLTQNYSDFAGIRDGDFDTAFLFNPTNLVVDTDTITGFTIGILEEPWGPQENEFSTDPAAQAPYTIGFNKVLSDAGFFSFQFVMGYDGTGNPNRHVDMDMTGVLIPEPGRVALALIALGAVGGASLFKRRRRQ